MELNDFLGSFAQENVTFRTQVVKTKAVGDNYWKTMIFVDSDCFVNTSDAGWVDIPGSTTIKALSVTADDYVQYTSGLLKSWLYDLFVSGPLGDCILVAFAASSATAEDRITALTTAYNTMKAYAYFKTILTVKRTDDDNLESKTNLDLLVTEITAFAQLCGADTGLLSSVPLLPYSTATPGTPSSDLVYAALNTAKLDAFMACYADTTRNVALFAAGQAMSILNESGTPVGNSFDMVKTGNVGSSGPDGEQLEKNYRDLLKGLNIQTYKPVGNNSGQVAAIGAMTLNGEVIQAQWIVAYVTYMTKVNVAQYITNPNILRNESTYGVILDMLFAQIGKFSQSGRLVDVKNNAPAFSNLPEAAGDEIIIPNAWSANYVDQLRNVTITGTLYIAL